MKSFKQMRPVLTVAIVVMLSIIPYGCFETPGDGEGDAPAVTPATAPISDPGVQPVVTSATVFQQNDPNQTPITSADIGDNVALKLCITDPDLDVTQVTITQYLQPDLVNPQFAPETVTLSPQLSVAQCYTPVLSTIAGPAGLWVITVDFSDAKGNSTGPTYITPTGFTVNPAVAPDPNLGTQPVVTSATVFQQSDPGQTPISSADIGDNVALKLCITDPDLDVSQVTITQYLQPDLVNPQFAPETVALAPQTTASQCYTPILPPLAGPAGLWVITVDFSDAKGNSSGPVYITPTGFTINPVVVPDPVLGTQPVVTSATVFQQSDPGQTPISSADIGDNVALKLCTTDPDLDVSQVTITQYLQPDLVNPQFAPETVALAPQTTASQCYTPILSPLSGPAGLWVITVDFSDAKGNSSGPVYITPTGFTINPVVAPDPVLGTQPVVTSATVFLQNDPDQTPITSANIGDYVAFKICITDPDLDASQITVKQYLQPNLVIPQLPVETVVLSSQIAASECYIDLVTITGPAGLWVVTLDVSDSKGNTSGPTYMTPVGFLVN